MKNLSMCTTAAAALSLIFVIGCEQPASSPTEIAAYEKSGMVDPDMDLHGLKPVSAERTGPYKVVPGDLLSITIPSMAPNAAVDATEVIVRRVAENGNIIVPMAGEVQVAGKGLTEVEAALVDAYYPKHLVNKPAIVATITDYRTVYVTVTGAVATPGRLQLKSDELSLVSLLSKAGGLGTGATVGSPSTGSPGGAQMVAIYTPKGGDKPALIPLRGGNTPMVDVALSGGERVEVLKLKSQTVTILGLVKTAGTFPLPIDSPTNVAQALGLAGGVDAIADPRYVVVYRENAKGELTATRFKMNVVHGNYAIFTDSTLAPVVFSRVRPGDVIMVEHNAHTRTRMFLHRLIFEIDFIPLNWGNNNNN